MKNPILLKWFLQIEPVSRYMLEIMKAYIATLRCAILVLIKRRQNFFSFNQAVIKIQIFSLKLINC